MQGTDTVLAAMAGVTALTVVGRTQDPTPAPALRIVVGAFAATAILLVVGQYAPGLAAGVATLALVSAAVIYGGPAFDAIGKVTK